MRNSKKENQREYSLNKKAREYKMLTFTSPQNDRSPCVAFNLFLFNLLSMRACVDVWEFRFLSIVSFFCPSPAFTSFVSTFHFVLFFFVAFHSIRIHPLILIVLRSTVRMNVPYSYFALALSTFRFFSFSFIFFCFVRISLSLSLSLSVCVRAVSLFSILFSCLYCLRFVSFFSLFSFLVCAFEQCEYCII